MRCELPKKIAILGAGRSGLAAAKALLDKSISVFISDTCPPKKLDFILASNGLAHVPHEADMHTDKVLHYDALIVSPGIRFDEDILCRARKAHLPVLPELELGWCLSHAPFLAVTGSSGKSTTVCLLGEIFKAAHKEYVVSGNIGIPVSAVAPGKSEECTVIAETSSFQLEAIQRFHPHIAVILNVTKNHLDRHAGFDAYFSAKTTITRNMTNGDIIVLNGMDDNLCSWIQENPKKIHTVYFGKVPVNSDGIWIDNGTLLYRWNTTSGSIIRVDELSIAGLHNQANACAAAAAAKAAGIDDDAIAQGLARFRGLPHRLEFIAEHNGIAF